MRVGLAPYDYEEPSLAAGMLIRLAHVTDLRAALDEVYARFGVMRPVYTDPTLVAGMPLKLEHINELRRATIAIETQPVD